MVSLGHALVAWLVNQRSKQNRSAAAVALEYDPGVLALILKPAGPDDHVKQTFAGWLWYDGRLERLWWLSLFRRLP
jgi:hypothetical protein